MQVLFTIAGLNPETGGPSQSVPALAKSLAATGVSPEIISLDYGELGGRGSARASRAMSGASPDTIPSSPPTLNLTPNLNLNPQTGSAGTPAGEFASTLTPNLNPNSGTDVPSANVPQASTLPPISSFSSPLSALPPSTPASPPSPISDLPLSGSARASRAASGASPDTIPSSPPTLNLTPNLNLNLNLNLNPPTRSGGIPAGKPPSPTNVATTFVPCTSPFARRLQWTPSFKRVLRERCLATGVEIIHDTGVWLLTNHAAAHVAAEFNLPRIVSPRGMLTSWALRHKSWKKRIAWLLYQRRDLESATVLHATSPAEVEDFRAAGFTQPIAMIPNGVDLPPAAPFPSSEGLGVGYPPPTPTHNLTLTPTLNPNPPSGADVPSANVPQASSLPPHPQCEQTLNSQPSTLNPATSQSPISDLRSSSEAPLLTLTPNLNLAPNSGADVPSANVLQASSLSPAGPGLISAFNSPLSAVPQPGSAGIPAGESPTLNPQPSTLNPATSPSPISQLRSSRESAALRTLLFLSRIHPKKGLPDLIKAWALARPQGWRVVIAGGDETGHTAEIKSEIKKLKLENDFQFLGPVSGDAKWALYRSADLFVLPSYSENFGIVIAEALASGLPVITTRATPWEELVSHRCGWWIDTGADSLAAALRDAMNRSDAERREMGIRGRQLVEEKYSWPALAAQMHAVYRWMLGQGTKPPCVV